MPIAGGALYAFLWPVLTPDACRSRCALPAVPSPVPVVVMVRVVGDAVMPSVIGRRAVAVVVVTVCAVARAPAACRRRGS